MQVDFYYYSYQCPLNYNMLRLLSECKDIELNTYDIAQKPELAEKHACHRPDYPRSVPFAAPKAPRKVTCGYKCPINTGNVASD